MGRIIRSEGQGKQKPKASPPPPPPEPEPRADDFVRFIDSVWFPLEIEGSDRKPRTVGFYKALLKTLKPYFQGMTLQEITSVEIQKYLRYLRKSIRASMESLDAEDCTSSLQHHHERTDFLQSRRWLPQQDLRPSERRFFEGALSRPTITIQSTPKAYGHFSCGGHLN
jgi:hypothetical protein